MAVTNYKCPACTGPVHFAGDSGRVECDYCGSSYDISQIEAIYAQQDKQAAEAFEQAETAEKTGSTGQWDTSNMTENWDEEGGKMNAYSCPSCGAELICDETTAATSCPYCGNPTIVPGQLSGTLKPDYVIPFKLSKEDAVSALKAFYKGKILLPKAFLNENHINEIKGVYVPFWLFDGKVDADITYKATKTHTHRRGDEIVTTIEHFRVRRAGTVDFRKIPVDGSTKMPDSHMDALEPFDYSQLQDFSTAYLPGFFADKYDVSIEDCSQRADERAKNSTVEALRRDIHGYDTCIPIDQKLRLERGEVRYALLPVWILNTRYKGTDYLFAMNGQTGKLVGNLPVDWAKCAALFLAILVGCTFLLSFLM